MTLRRRLRVSLAVVSLLWLTPASSQQPPPREELMVFAPASLTDVLGELGKIWNTRGQTPVKFSFAASSVLARQIEAGGRADVFLSADQEWMDYLAKRQLITPGSRRDVASNRLVLIAPADSTLRIDIKSGTDLRKLLGDGRLSTADPDTVPAGRYARAALVSLGVWDQVADRLVRAENVRAAMIYVARGEAPLGIVYATDARVDAKVRVVTIFPESSHPPITYPAATTATARAEATAFIAFLGSSEAAAAWAKYGFLEPDK